MGSRGRRLGRGRRSAVAGWSSRQDDDGGERALHFRVCVRRPESTETSVWSLFPGPLSLPRLAEAVAKWHLSQGRRKRVYIRERDIPVAQAPSLRVAASSFLCLSLDLPSSTRRARLRPTGLSSTLLETLRFATSPAMQVPASQSASSLLHSRRASHRFSCTCGALDALYTPQSFASTPRRSHEPSSVEAGLAEGAVLEVLGPPGVGKTRTLLGFALAERFREDGGEVLVVGALHPGASSPFLLGDA